MSNNSEYYNEFFRNQNETPQLENNPNFAGIKWYISTEIKDGEIVWKELSQDEVLITPTQDK